MEQSLCLDQHGLHIPESVILAFLSPCLVCTLSYTCWAVAMSFYEFIILYSCQQE